MATYATDLQTISLADSNTGWAELAGHLSGAAPAQDTESYIHNAAAVSQSTGQAVGTTAGMQYDYGSAVSWTSGDVFIVWQMFAAPTNIFPWASGGMRFGVGSSVGNMNFYNALGDDFGNYPYGGWQNTAIDPEVTADAIDGTPTAGVYQIFGSLPNMRAKITKGSPHLVDAIRYGRGEFQVTGTAATFSGMAAVNDADTARWGLFQSSGGSYLWKGLMSLGLTGTSVTFSDQNKAIRIEDTPRVSASFNKIEINNTSSSVTFTSIQISGIQTSITGSAPISKGDFEVVDNATVSKDGCTFVDMGTFIYQSNSTISSTTYRRCGQITSGGAVFSGCTITNSTAAASVIASSYTDIEDFTDCTFTSDGTNHAIDLGTVSATASVSWANFLTGYAGTDGSTGNEALKVNVASGQTLTISVTSGYDTPSVYNTGTGTVTVVTGTRTVTVAVTSIDGPVSGANVFLAAAAGGPFPFNVSVSINNTTPGGTTARVTHSTHGLSTGDKVIISGASEPLNNGVFTITKVDNNTYDYTMSGDPAGAAGGNPTSTFVFLKGLATAGTDSNEISMTRSIPSAQPVTGWARKTSVAPDYDPPNYKQGAISGTVSSTGDTTFTPVLISDD
jgi:hypothetical protein